MAVITIVTRAVEARLPSVTRATPTPKRPVASSDQS
jgi:hypothetical protein